MGLLIGIDHDEQVRAIIGEPVETSPAFAILIIELPYLLRQKIGACLPFHRAEFNYVHADDRCVMAYPAEESEQFVPVQAAGFGRSNGWHLAGIERIGAISVDYAGALLDVRHTVPEDIHEVRRALSLARACGYELRGDDDRLRLRTVAANPLKRKDYVVVHPGATMPARAWSQDGNAQVVRMLAERGDDVVVTGTANERGLTAAVSDGVAQDLGGRTSFSEFAAVVRDARAVISGNTSAVHVASAVATSVVHIFPPTIPHVRFAPWRVPHVLLGDQNAPCAGCRARECPVPGQPCVGGITAAQVVSALDALVMRAMVSA